MVSLKEVANLASVSLMTASRAINSPEQLRPETYQRVMQAIESLNYVPDFAARKMRGHATKNINPGSTRLGYGDHTVLS